MSLEMTTSTKGLPNLNTELEEGLTVRDVMVMAAEEAMIKAGILQPVSFEDAFKN